MKSNFLLGLFLLGSAWVSNAQTKIVEPIFGSVLERKVEKDSTEKRTMFNPLKPAFLRIGIMGGGLINDKVAGISGLRIEYGFSNRWSLVGEIQSNRSERSTFPRGQTSLGINWMPFKSKRVQPFFGVGGGIGGNRFGSGRFDKNGKNSKDDLFDKRDNNHNVQGFAFARTGLNYVLFKRIIAMAETGYQLPFNTKNSNGGLSFRVGASYQFGNTKPK